VTSRFVSRRTNPKDREHLLLSAAYKRPGNGLAMQWTRGRQIQTLVLLFALCAAVITGVLIWHKTRGKGELEPASIAATYFEESLGLRVTLPQPWITLSSSDTAMVTSQGEAALAESGHDMKKLGTEHPDGKARLLTAMNPVTRESFQILKQEKSSSVDESRPEAVAEDLRSTFLSILSMQPLGPVERLDTGTPVAHFNGILTVKGAPIYQSVFIAVVKKNAITFVFSGPADSVLGESKRSFPQWVSFDHSTVR